MPQQQTQHGPGLADRVVEPEPTPHGPDAATELHITEPRRPPLLGALLASSASVPTAIGAVAAAVAPVADRPLILVATLVWAASIVLFLSGVRRGLSFRTQGGATLAEVANSLLLFMLGLGGLVATLLLAPRTALCVLLLGYLTLAVLDPLAARRGEAPPYFAQLRPIQMAVPILSLAALLVMVW